MERVLSVEEKIRRAEEIYARRKGLDINNTSKKKVDNKKDIRLLKKIITQLVICTFLYLVIYFINNKEYIFSNDFINKVDEVLSYDIDFNQIYDNAKDKMNSMKNLYMIKDNENTQNEKKEEEQENVNTSNLNQKNGIGGAVENLANKAVLELPEEDEDIKNVKKTSSFIKPTNGIVTSRYGWRESENEKIPKNHTGTDIGASLGSKIVSATDGEVVLESEEGDYRKTLKNSNW